MAGNDETADRFEEHPPPDRFFLQIEPAEIEMRVMDFDDDVSLRSQRVPGGRFAFEISASYAYAERDCAQSVTLDRAAAESLYDHLDRVLEVDDR